MKKVIISCVAIFLFLFLGELLVTEAQTCNVNELISPCFATFAFSSPPSSACCTKLREQQPCLCEYIKNPAYAQYISSTLISRVLTACKIPVPKCI
uniref:Bifunctional inhibitor/plant lipid transfer protein/seed storage helical domain-containing protein n=1 Tax=Solanum lycopersicum TaxID=4081 RepID=A0A3Q7FG81_SOLLC